MTNKIYVRIHRLTDIHSLSIVLQMQNFVVGLRDVVLFRVLVDEISRDTKMPLVRNQNIGHPTHNASEVHNLRGNETEEKHRKRLEANTMLISQSRSTTFLEESLNSIL